MKDTDNLEEIYQANLAAALALAGAGIPIFPAIVDQQPGSTKWQKRPLVERWQEVATTDVGQIREWWKKFPFAVPAIELRGADLVVIDLDRHDGGADGVAAFTALEAENDGLAAHPEVDTAGNGKHHIFCQPTQKTFGNRRGNLPEGIDVRGAGGWIVAPGATRSDGARWQPSPGSMPLANAYRDSAIPPLPIWVADLIHPARSPPRPTARERAYATEALRAASAELQRTPPGSRNNALNRASYCIAQMVARGWLDRGEAAAVLRDACVANGLVADDGSDAVQSTLASGFKAGMASPHADLRERPRSFSDQFPSGGKELPALSPITLEDLLGLDMRPREFVIEPLIHERELVMVYAWRGVGKTWFALALGHAIAAGGTYLRWTAKKPRRVLHVCGEMPAVDLKQRFEQVVTAVSLPEPGFLRIVSADLHELGIPDLATKTGQTAMDAVLGDAEVIIFDNVSTLFRTGQENESESWVPVQNWLLQLRRKGRSVVIIHHSNKAKAQRGTSKREDVLDVVLNLREPSDYEPSEGARFEIHFEKSRGLSGTEAVTSFEATLEIRDGNAVWTMRDIADARQSEIAELSEGGMSVRKIAAELGISKSAVQRALKKD